MPAKRKITVKPNTKEIESLEPEAKKPIKTETGETPQNLTVKPNSVENPEKVVKTYSKDDEDEDGDDTDSKIFVSLFFMVFAIVLIVNFLV